MPDGEGAFVHRRVRVLLIVAIALLLTTAGVLAVRQSGVLDDGTGPAAETTGAAQPRVEENRLVDARTGRDFVPRGVNWSSFEYACAQGWGLSALDTTAGAADPHDAQAAAIASWGANTVRLPLNQDCWLGSRGAPVSDQYEERTYEAYRDEVARFVTALNRHGLVVILDLHSRKRAEAPEFGNLAMPDAESLVFWRSVATAYRHRPSVMFDAFNEPYSRYDATDELVFDLTWACWRDGGCEAPAEDDQTATDGTRTYPVQGMAAVVGEIRDSGAEQPILLGGLDYANDLSRWLEFAPDDDQLVAAFHSYDFKACSTLACWDSVLGPLADSVPVLTSELGAEDPLDGYVDRYLEWADDRGIGAVFWVWAAHASDPMSLLVEQGGTPTEYGVRTRAWLSGAPVPAVGATAGITPEITPETPSG
ncbi:Cellulase (glycosyl hydrolase family 5) [Nocardioides lianchengensis]|uniref:Cellulase (Glycosyl hydrolase family 5) n=1 Tax=Nocardioides lianchengensis TaxID=1045774 RepID=A0A1G6U030_9ACTN|nr:Cellulase (glycosyl hydrolase family 5) [Nocardioides lianchengensis]